MTGAGKSKSLVMMGGGIQWRRITDEADNTRHFSSEVCVVAIIRELTQSIESDGRGN